MIMNIRKSLRFVRQQISNEKVFLELSLIAIVLGLTFTMHLISTQKLVILNLFYLPIVLSGFFLGRYHTGVLALLAVISASVVATEEFDRLVISQEPLVIAVVMTVWAAVLGLTALLVGTLSDDRSRKEHELHEAYVGVVDVLSKYLQSANPRLKARSTRVVELSQSVATYLHMSPQQIDDIRVAALMQDLGKIEVTMRILSKVMGPLEAISNQATESRFQGIDLVHSLGSVLRGAIPLLSHEDSSLGWCSEDDALTTANMPMGARIIRLARAFDDLTEGGLQGNWATPTEALKELRRQSASPVDTQILNALETLANTSQEPRAFSTAEPTTPGNPA